MRNAMRRKEKMVVLKSFSALIAIVLFIFLIKALIDWHKKYKAFVEFLRIYHDSETM